MRATVRLVELRAARAARALRRPIQLARYVRPSLLAVALALPWALSGAAPGLLDAGRVQAARASPAAPGRPSATQSAQQAPPLPAADPTAVVQAAWEAIGRLYFDSRMAGQDWQAVRERYLALARQSGTDGYLLAARMLQELGPEAGFVLTPQQASEARARSPRESLVGVGVIIVQTDAGEVLVRSVLPGGPAERGGVRRGDRIAAVDGVPTAGRSLDEVAMAIRGQANTAVRLDLLGPDGAIRRLTLTRRPYTYEPRVQARVLPDNIGYLHLPHFREGMETAFLGELRRLYRTRALVLDLRDSAPGGSLITLSHIAGLITQEPLGLLVSRDGVAVLPSRKATQSDNPLIPAPTEIDFYDRPIAVLVDETSRFHELAFALKENRRAVLVGRPMSAGGGQVQTCTELPGGGEMCVTSMRFFSSRGRPLVGPVVPDVVVPVDRLFLERWAAGGDLDVEKAVEVLQRQLERA